LEGDGGRNKKEDTYKNEKDRKRKGYFLLTFVSGFKKFEILSSSSKALRKES